VVGNDNASRTKRYLLLKEANALYAACGDAMGFNVTSDRLREEFPLEEAGPVPPQVANTAVHYDPAPPKTSEHSVGRFGPYEVEVIEESGMAIVYRTKKDGKDIALKCLKDFYKDDNEFLMRFLKEVYTCENLHHPNIVRTFDHGDVEGIPYFTMELLVGETLRQPIGKGRRYAPRDAARIVNRSRRLSITLTLRVLCTAT